MDSAASSGQTPNLDSLNTVQFRQHLKGYHQEDVDEYLDSAAREFASIGELHRQTEERLKEATERVVVLERRIATLQAKVEELSSTAPLSEPSSSSAPASGGSSVPVAQPSSESAPVAAGSVQRTLELALEFVDHAKTQAESEAHTLVSEAAVRAETMLEEAKASVEKMTEEGVRDLRSEVAYLTEARDRHSDEVDRIASHLESERSRLRGALSELLSWVDDNVHPPALPVGSSAGPQVEAGFGGQWTGGLPESHLPESHLVTGQGPQPTETLSGSETSNDDPRPLIADPTVGSGDPQVLPAGSLPLEGFGAVGPSGSDYQSSGPTPGVSG